MTYKQLTLNAKQKALFDTLKANGLTYILADGGSRSGKTLLICDTTIKRAFLYPGTKHIICRKKKTTCIATVWKQTFLPRLIEAVGHDCFSLDKTNNIITLPNGSTIWTGGFDDAAQADKILSTEWATIFVNEGTELTYRQFCDLMTRLNVPPAETNITRKFIADCNPRPPSHWIHKVFIEKIYPETGEPLDYKDKIGRVWFSPYDNAKNISPEYLKDLESLRGMARKRFLEGIWASNFKGQVFNSFNRENNVDDTIEFNPAYEQWTAWDFGIQDSCVVLFAQVKKIPVYGDNRLGAEIEFYDEIVSTQKPAEWYADVIQARMKENLRLFKHTGDPSGSSRGAGLDSWFSRLANKGIRLSKAGLTGKSPEDMISNANRLMASVKINAEKCPTLVSALENWSYPLDAAGQVIDGSKPIHDEHSHRGTAFYYFFMHRFPPTAGGGGVYTV